ncbi:hypothetical protein M0R45_026753 [Rubus argutus]|uniref:non-specific serine/threonine protein kinase n=1 Tax=Rubus argutus TaxID=59490 RepID=A0AAW1WYD0_RUBAR
MKFSDHYSPIHSLRLYGFLIFSFILFLFSCLIPIHSLSTVSISENSNNQTLICSLTPQHSFLNCTSFPSGIRIHPVRTNTSFTGLVGGYGFLCALRSSSSSSSSVMICWRFSANGTNMKRKQIYSGPALKELKAGNSHVCGVVNETNRLQCWQWRGFSSSTSRDNFSRSIAVGDNFVCGVSEIGEVTCAGNNTKVVGKEPRKGNYSYVSAGFNYACAISLHDKGLHCWGETKGEKLQGEFTLWRWAKIEVVAGGLMKQLFVGGKMASVCLKVLERRNSFQSKQTQRFLRGLVVELFLVLLGKRNV